MLGTHEDTEAESFPFAIARHATGRHHRRVLAFSFPVLMAHFGTVTSCHKVKVVAGEPAHGCGAFTNAHHISNAAVVLTRGECQFADKAHNVETADGAVMIVINDAGPAIRMPISEGDSVNVPSVMLSKVSPPPLSSSCALFSVACCCKHSLFPPRSPTAMLCCQF